LIIQSIEVIHTKIPLKKSYKLSRVFDVLESSQPIIIKVHTDSGITGLGETDPMDHFTEETAETIMAVLQRNLCPAVCGMDPLGIAAIHESMDRHIKGNFLAKAAIDMACYDIAGKAMQTPAYTFLGGKLRNEIPVMWSLGDGAPEANAEEASRLVNEEGYHTLMVKVGNDDMRRDVARVRAIRKAMEQDVSLIADANQGWDVETSVKFAAMIEDCGIAFFEQPVPYWDIKGLARIRKSIRIPLSADESLFSIHDALQLIHYDAVDIFSIKVAKNGGIYKAKKIMDLAEANGIRCLMNSLLEEGITQAASLQLGLSSPNIHECGHAYFSPLRMDDDISDYWHQLNHGIVKPSGLPGLGVAIDESILSKYQVGRYEIKHS
jgi:L-alanine-DL-glutamate epimerase-like enolase superfamily enzyme